MDRDPFAPFGAILKDFRQRKGITQQQLAAQLGVHRNTIGSWERSDYLPENRGIVLELARHLRLSDWEARSLLEASLTAVAPYWSVPALRNPFFTGREEILEMLHSRLSANQGIALTQPYALYGLGGIGKTQVAIEYVYRYALEHSAVFWLAAETAASLITSLQQIASQLQLPEHRATEQSQMVEEVQRWLATHSGWLLIGDNVENFDLFQAVVPPSVMRQGAVLLTTRRQALGILAEPLKLSPMGSEEGVTLVLRRARQLGTCDPGSAPRLETRQWDASAALELVHLLGGLPLALDQAGAYIDETACSVAEYLRRYHQQRKQVLARRGMHGGAHPASVTTTLRLSVEHVEHEYPEAANLLRLCTFLHPDAIPEELLGTEMPPLEPRQNLVVADPYQFDLALATLRNASLISRYPETRTLSVHRLVQAVLADQMEPAEVRLWSARAVCAVNAAFPEPEFPVWAQCERCLAQALACIPLIALEGDDLPEAGELLYKAGGYLLERGHYQAAEPLLGRAVALGERQYGTNHSALIPRLEKHAELSWKQGKYERVELLLHRTLTLGEQHLGPDHLRTAETLTHLASLYEKQGKCEQAEELYQRALHIQEQQLDPDHPTLATTLNNLGVVYRIQGKYEAAEPLYQRALSIREQQLGLNHPQTATTLQNLAMLYRFQGKYEQAEPLIQRGLRINEQQLGPDHPQTAIALSSLAFLYQRQGKYEQAEPLFQRALHIREQRLGPEHPETVKIRNDYASFLAQRRSLSKKPREERHADEHSFSKSAHPQKPLPHASSERIAAAFSQETDPLQAFLATCCKLHPQAWSRAGELWQAYQRWAEEQQESFPLSRRAFAAHLKAYGCRTDRTNTARIWRGITVVTTHA